MTIMHAKQLVSGVMLDGYQISCDKDQASAFVPSKKHLPPEVIANKFRDRAWEVNANGKDYCPNCIEKKRGMKKGTKLGPRQKSARIIPLRQHQSLHVPSLAKVLTGCGFANAEITELEHPHFRRFLITLRNMPEIALGRLIHAEGEIVAGFNVSLQGSMLKPDFTQTKDGATLKFEFVVHWYLTLEQDQNRFMGAAE